MTIFPVLTVPFKLYIKTVTVEGLRAAFAQHPDPKLAKTNVTLEYPRDQIHYPCIVVRFYERDIMNAGIAHREYAMFNADTTDDPNVKIFKLRHYFYTGDFEFAVFALSSYDRDLMAASLIQILTMADTEAWTGKFLERVYPTGDPKSLPGFADQNDQFNCVVFNTDKASGFGESEAPAPWGAEDDLIYQTSYRIGIWGEYYSLPDTPRGVIDQVSFFPFADQFVEDLPAGGTRTDMGPWIGEGPKTEEEYLAAKAEWEAMWRYGDPEPGSTP